MTTVAQRSPAQQKAWQKYWDTHLERARTLLVAECDRCDALFEGTRAALRKARWVKRWRRWGLGLRVQVDVCPDCRGQQSRERS